MTFMSEVKNNFNSYTILQTILSNFKMILLKKVLRQNAKTINSTILKSICQILSNSFQIYFKNFR